MIETELSVAPLHDVDALERIGRMTREEVDALPYGLMLFDGDPVAQLRKVEDSYRAISRELLLEEWLARPRVAAYVDNVLRLTAALQ